MHFPDIKEAFYAHCAILIEGETEYGCIKAFADKLKEYATAFGIDIMSMPEINISSMLQAAQEAGATESQIIGATTILLALTRDIEAESGQVWADCWAGLKSRLLNYLIN